MGLCLSADFVDSYCKPAPWSKGFHDRLASAGPLANTASQSNSINCKESFGVDS